MQLPKIIFPESDDSRIREAVLVLAAEQACVPVVLTAGKSEASWPQGVEVVALDSVAIPDTVALPQVDPRLVAGATLVADGQADAIVSGAVATTAEVFRVYRKVIGLAPGFTRAASCFLMERAGERYLFADCAINITPDAATLAQIAVMTSNFAEKVGIESKAAFLSFATGDSARDESVALVQEAMVLTQQDLPELAISGPIQADVALVPEVAATKAPQSVIQGDATVFIFPDLNSGNIAYKLVERLGGFRATGPILLGFDKPAHDLSRGCSVEDIVSVAKIAILESQTAT